jgi:protein-S-isoprenylcysteine O-methyltransferase Ste14
MPNSHRGGGRHEDRDDLTGEHALTDIGQLILAVLFAGVWIADSFFLKATILLNAHVALAIRIPVGAILLVMAAFLARASLGIIFGETRPEPRVVRRGVFAVVRHPMYLSEILLYLGLLLLSLSLAAGAVWLIAIGFLHYVSRAEEKLLLARFGSEYAAYMRDVPMWVPRLRRQ